MLAARTMQASLCATCRLRALINVQRLSRSRPGAQISRAFGTTTTLRLPRRRWGHASAPRTHDELGGTSFDTLPSDSIQPASQVAHRNDNEFETWDERQIAGTGVLKETSNGDLQEIVYDDEPPRRHRRVRSSRSENNDELLASDIAESLSFTEKTTEIIDEDYIEADHVPRAHHLTTLNRFSTSPLTVTLPRLKYVEPTALMLKATPNVHLSQAAHRMFGGVGLPYSASTPSRLKTMQQKAIVLNAGQNTMSPIEGDVFMAALTPAIFASVTSVLVESRKRLGTAWAEEMVKKAAAGQLKILDAGGAGAGVMAVREVLRAEWQRMHENDDATPTEIAIGDGRMGGSGTEPPLGQATVLTGSDTLRLRMSQLLEDTTFIPRLPNYAHTESAKLVGKFDIVIAPHTLWPLKEDYIRKGHVENLWSLVSNDGGLLILLEKGVSRGFEMVAAAREMLLDKHVSSPGLETRRLHIDSNPAVEWDDQGAEVRQKDVGMIVAPCTNHVGCPMYVPKGKVKGRKDICAFEQRYTRPAYLQNILGAKEKNWEDVEFSYLSIMRGRDLRLTQGVHGIATQSVEQGPSATERAFDGYQTWSNHATADQVDEMPHSLILPRMVLPPLKRQRHVILDVCTPSGTLERWTVPKSFGKQAYRDARKSTWGDLWAMGAKHRRPRETHISKHALREAKGDGTASVESSDSKAGKSKSTKQQRSHGVGADDHGRLIFGEKDIPLDGGRTRTTKIKGIREKRDKKGTGNGRRKSQMDD